MAVGLQRLGIETFALIRHFDVHVAGRTRHRYALAATATVAKTIRQRFLQHPKQRDSHRQRGRVGGVAQSQRHGDARFTLMVIRGALQCLGQRKLFDLRQLQTAQDGAQVRQRGLQLPEIEQLSVAETLQRAADDHQRKTGVAVPLTPSNAPDSAPLPVRITLFRVLQESLANGFRHGDGLGQRVAVTGSAGQVNVEVADDGKGFDPNGLKADGHFGLDWMRERVELLGGSFEVRSALGSGTVVRVSLPLWQLERIDG
jgi:hypothetical protein